VSVSQSFHTITLQWQQSELPVDGEDEQLRAVVGFQVRYIDIANSGQSAEWLTIVDAPELEPYESYAVSNLLPASQYLVVVRLLYSKNTGDSIDANVPLGFVASSWSPSVLLQTSGNERAGTPAPVISNQIPAPLEVVFSWNAPPDPQWHLLIADQQLPFDSDDRQYESIVYHIESAASESGPWASIASVPITATPLEFNDYTRPLEKAKGYHYRISCQAIASLGGDEELSGRSMSVCKPGTPGTIRTPGQFAPQSFSVSSTPDLNSNAGIFSLRWQPPVVDAGMLPILGYEFEYSVRGVRLESVHIDDTNEEQHIFTIDSPERGIAYEFSLYAVDANGRGLAAIASTSLLSPTNPPRNVFTRNRIGNQLELVWSPPLRNGIEFQYPITHYYIEQRVFGESVWQQAGDNINVTSENAQRDIVMSGRVSSTVHNLASDTLYQFRVFAVNELGSSISSASVLARTFESQYDMPAVSGILQSPANPDALEVVWLAFERMPATLYSAVPVTEYHINWRAVITQDPLNKLNEWQSTPVIVPVAPAQEGQYITAKITGIEADMQYMISVSAASELYGAGEEALIQYTTAIDTTDTCMYPAPLPAELLMQSGETVHTIATVVFDYMYIPVPESSLVTGEQVHVTQSHWFRLYGANRVITMDWCDAIRSAPSISDIVATVLVYESDETTCPAGRDRTSWMANTMPPPSAFGDSPAIFRSRLHCDQQNPDQETPWSFFAASGAQYAVMVGVESSVATLQDRSRKQFDVAVHSALPDRFLYWTSSVELSLDFSVFNPHNDHDNTIVMQHDVDLSVTRSVHLHHMKVELPVESYVSISTRQRFETDTRLLNDTTFRYSLVAPANQRGELRLTSAEKFELSEQYDVPLSVDMRYIRDQDVDVLASTTVGPIHVDGILGYEQRIGQDPNDPAGYGRTQTCSTRYDYTDQITGIETNQGTSFLTVDICHLDSLLEFRLATAIPLGSFICTVSLDGELLSSGRGDEGGCEASVVKRDFLQRSPGTHDLVFTYQLIDSRLATTVRTFTEQLELTAVPEMVSLVATIAQGLAGVGDNAALECPGRPPSLRELDAARSNRHYPARMLLQAEEGVDKYTTDSGLANSRSASYSLYLKKNILEVKNPSFTFKIDVQFGFTFNAGVKKGRTRTVYFYWKTTYQLGDIELLKKFNAKVAFAMAGDRQGQLVFRSDEDMPEFCDSLDESLHDYNRTTQACKAFSPELQAAVSIGVTVTIQVYPRKPIPDEDKSEKAESFRRMLDLLEDYASIEVTCDFIIGVKGAGKWLESYPLVQYRGGKVDGALTAVSSFIQLLSTLLIAPQPKDWSDVGWTITVSMGLKLKADACSFATLSGTISGSLVFASRGEDDFGLKTAAATLDIEACLSVLCKVFSISFAVTWSSVIDNADRQQLEQIFERKKSSSVTQADQAALNRIARKYATEALLGSDMSTDSPDEIMSTRKMPHRGAVLNRRFLGQHHLDAFTGGHNGASWTPSFQDQHKRCSDLAARHFSGATSGTILHDVYALALPTLASTPVLDSASGDAVSVAAWGSEHVTADHLSFCGDSGGDLCLNDLSIEVSSYRSHCWTEPKYVSRSPYPEWSPHIAVAPSADLPTSDSGGESVAMMVFQRYWNNTVHDALRANPWKDAGLVGLMFTHSRVVSSNASSTSWTEPKPLPGSGSELQFNPSLNGLIGDSGSFAVHSSHTFRVLYVTNLQDQDAQTTNDSALRVAYFDMSSQEWSDPEPMLRDSLTEINFGKRLSSVFYLDQLTGSVVEAVCVIRGRGNSMHAQLLMREWQADSVRPAWRDMTSSVPFASIWHGRIVSVQLAVQDRRRIVVLWQLQNQPVEYGFVEPISLLRGGQQDHIDSVRGPFELPFGVPTEEQTEDGILLLGHGSTPVVIQVERTSVIKHEDADDEPVHQHGFATLEGDTFGRVFTHNSDIGQSITNSAATARYQDATGTFGVETVMVVEHTSIDTEAEDAAPSVDFYNIEFSEFDLNSDLVVTHVVVDEHEHQIDLSSVYTATVSVTVMNKGSVRSLQTAVVMSEGTISGPAPGSSSEVGGMVPSLAAGQSEHIVFEWKHDQSTLFGGYLWIEIDPDNSELEMNEQNNVLGVHISAPQLAIAAIDLIGPEHDTCANSANSTVTQEATLEFDVRDNLNIAKLACEVTATLSHVIVGGSPNVSLDGAARILRWTSTAALTAGAGEGKRLSISIPLEQLTSSVLHLELHRGDGVIVPSMIDSKFTSFSPSDVSVELNIPAVVESRAWLDAHPHTDVIIAQQPNLFFENSLDVTILNSNEGLLRLGVRMNQDSSRCLDNVTVSIYGIAYDNASVDSNGTSASRMSNSSRESLVALGYTLWGEAMANLGPLGSRTVYVDAPTVGLEDDVDSAMFHVVAVLDIEDAIFESRESDNMIGRLVDITSSNSAELATTRASFFVVDETLSLSLHLSTSFRSRAAIGEVEAHLAIASSATSNVSISLGSYTIDFGQETQDCIDSIIPMGDWTISMLRTFVYNSPDFAIFVTFNDSAKLGTNAITLVLPGRTVWENRERGCVGERDIVITALPTSIEDAAAGLVRWQAQSRFNEDVRAQMSDVVFRSGGTWYRVKRWQTFTANSITVFTTSARGGAITVTYRVRMIEDSDTVEPSDDVLCSPPAISTATDVRIELDANGTATLQAQDVITSVESECGVSRMKVYPSKLSVAHLGTTTVLVRVFDNYTRATNVQVEIQVVDVTPPTFVSCPSDIVREVPRADNGTALSDRVHVEWVEPIAFDSASGIASVQSDLVDPDQRHFMVGETLITYTATDNSNNTNSACSFYVIVLDRDTQCSTKFERPPNPVMSFGFDPATAESVVQVSFEQDSRFDEHGFKTVTLAFGNRLGGPTRGDSQVEIGSGYENDTCVFSTKLITPVAPYSGIEHPEPTQQNLWRRVIDDRACNCMQTWELRVPSNRLRAECFPPGVTSSDNREEVFTQTLYTHTTQIRGGLSTDRTVLTQLPLTVSIRISKTASATPGEVHVIGNAYALQLLGEFRVVVDENGVHTVDGVFITETPWPYRLSLLNSTHGPNDTDAIATDQFGQIAVQADQTTAACNAAVPYANDHSGATGPPCVQDWHFSYTILDACVNPDGTRRLDNDQLNFAFQAECVYFFDGECAPKFSADIGLSATVSSGEFCVSEELGLIASATTYAWSDLAAAPGPESNDTDAYFLTSPFDDPTEVQRGDFGYRQQSVFTTEATLYGEVHVGVEDNQYPVEQTTIYRIASFQHMDNDEVDVSDPSTLRGYTLIFKDCSLREIVSCENGSTTYTAHDSVAVANHGFGSNDGDDTVHASSHSRFVLQLNSDTMQAVDSDDLVTQIRLLVDVYVETTTPPDSAFYPQAVRSNTVLKELSHARYGQSRMITYEVHPQHPHNDHATLQSPASTNTISAQASIAYVNARDSGPQDDEDAGAAANSSSGAAIGTAAVVIAIACAVVIVAAVVFRKRFASNDTVTVNGDAESDARAPVLDIPGPGPDADAVLGPVPSLGQSLTVSSSLSLTRLNSFPTNHFHHDADAEMELPSL
jgi:HYR domain/CARDB/Fibronectin type III domain